MLVYLDRCRCLYIASAASHPPFVFDPPRDKRTRVSWREEQLSPGEGQGKKRTRTETTRIHATGRPAQSEQQHRARGLISGKRDQRRKRPFSSVHRLED